MQDARCGNMQKIKLNDNFYSTVCRLISIKLMPKEKAKLKTAVQ
jgi:hypothetical protein